MDRDSGRRGSDAPDDGEAGRLKFQSIVEAAEAAADRMPWRDDPAAHRLPQAGPPRVRWSALSRQVLQASRLGAVLFFCSVVIGWPLGKMLAYWQVNGGLDGWSPLGGVPLEAFMLATLVPILLLLIGYIMSRQMTIMDAAESIARAARQFMRPDEAAAEGARSVGLVVREQMDAMNAGLDDALRRLASAEAMIRQHVDVIETAGTSIETRTSGAVTRIADERARLIELTENLNHQADAFATAIAEKAQAGIEALHSTDNLTDRAQAHLEERLARLETAAQRALESFNALSAALRAADETMRATAGAIETSAAQTQAASERATRASEAAAEAAARNAANVGASAQRASEDAKKAADAAIESAAREAERASRSAYEAAEREAGKIADATNRIFGDVRKSTSELVARVSRDTEQAGKLSEAAQKTADAAAKASASLAKASAEAEKNAEAALAKADATAKKIEERNKALVDARAALEAENTRLETLIEEQRKRADRLADAIATQTERLSKLAEAQIREHEASARLAEGTAAAKAATENKAAGTRDDQLDAARRKEGALEDYARTEKPLKTPGRKEPEKKESPARRTEADGAQGAAPNVLDLGDAAGDKRPGPANGARRRLDEAAEDIAQRRKPARAEPPLDLADTDKKSAETSRRNKQKVTWREILDATDGAEPLDLAATSAAPPQQDDGAANAIKIISRLQTFTYDLETRLYGDPPASLRERFERGDRNVFANRILRLNESDVKRRIRVESGRDKQFEREIHEFLQGFERLLEDATTSETADEDLEEYLSSPLGRVYLLIGATVGYFA